MRISVAYVEIDPDTDTYFGIVPGIPGAHTQGDTIEELRDNMKEVLELCLQEYDGDLPHFVCVQEIELPDEAA